MKNKIKTCASREKPATCFWEKPTTYSWEKPTTCSWEKPTFCFGASLAIYTTWE